MSLPEFIHLHHEEIIREFAAFAKTLMPPGANMSDAELRDHAKANGWRIRDYRTGRKAARAGLFAAGVTGAVAGSAAAAVAIRRKVR